MAEEVAALVIRLEATQSRFQRDIERAQRTFDRAMGSVQRTASTTSIRVTQANTRMADSFATTAQRTQRSSRAIGQQIQNVGFQVGDFAVQVASGQSALVALTQQGAQVAGAFGPIGAVLGAVGAILGATALYFIRAGEAAREGAGATREFENSLSTMDGAVSDLEGTITDYIEAIKDTGDAQQTSTDKIVASTKREYEAKRQLYQLELERQRLAISSNQARISELQADEAERRAPLDQLLQGGPQNPIAGGAVSPDVLRRFNERRAEIEARIANDPATQELRRLEPQTVLLEEAANRLQEALGRSFEDAVAGAQSNRKGRGKRGRSADNPFKEALDQAEKLLETERRAAETFGKSRAEVEAYRIEQDLLAAAQQQYGTVTEGVRAVIGVYADDVRTAVQAVEDMAAAQDRARQAAEEQKKAQEELNRAIESMGDRFTSAIQQADSFADALKRVGLELLNVALQSLSGAGPLGGITGNLIGGLAAGVSPGTIAAGIGGFSTPAGGVYAKGAAFSRGSVIPFARGGVVSGSTMFPMSGGRTGLMGEAGPEAVMPLARGADGKLGVRGGGSTIVNVTIQANDVSSFRSSSGQVAAQLARAVSVGQRRL